MTSELIILLLRAGVVLALYLFLLQVVLVVRRDLRKAGAEPAARLPAPRARLLVLENGTASLPAGSVVDLTDVNSLGRGPTNSVRLSDDSVSTEHARLVHRGRQWWLEDLGSTNGSTVNAVRVERPTVVAPGDLITLGRVRLRLEAS